jgi:hypothetical protein
VGPKRRFEISAASCKFIVVNDPAEIVSAWSTTPLKSFGGVIDPAEIVSAWSMTQMKLF